MARIARGAVTLTDINDGTTPITAVLTNQNHTFAASPDGTVSSDTRNMFSTGVLVFVGTTKATVKATDDDNNWGLNQYRIKSVSVDSKEPSGATTPTFTRTTSSVSVASWAKELYQATVSITVNITNDVSTSPQEVVLELTLSSVRQGEGGVVISLSPSSQVFYATSTGAMNADQDDIVIDVETAGSTGALKVYTSLDGNTWALQSATSATTAGSIKGWDVDDEDPLSSGNIGASFVKLVLSAENLGDSNNQLAVKVEGASGGLDTITIVKVRDGLAAISVAIKSSSNGFVFKNNNADGNSPAKELSVIVTDMADGSLLTPTSYQWLRDNDDDVYVISATNRTVVPADAPTKVVASGASFDTIIVDAGEIDDGSAELFTCVVTV